MVSDCHAAGRLHQVVQVALKDLQHAVDYKHAKAVCDEAELPQTRKVDILVVAVSFLLLQIGLQLLAKLTSQLPR